MLFHLKLKLITWKSGQSILYDISFILGKVIS